MTTLFYSPGACSLAPHIVLEWIGAPYEVLRVKTGSDELRAINPSGAVPALREDDGWILTQASAILDYLAHKHPEAGLGGGDGLRERAEVERWLAYFTSDLHASFWPIFTPTRYTLDPGDGAKEAVVGAAENRVRTVLGILEAHLAGREWILDTGRSVIDAYAFPMLRWAQAKLPGGLADFPNIRALFDRLAADPAVQRVLERERAG